MSDIPKIKIAGPEIIPTIDPPILNYVESPVIRGLSLPIVNIPNPRINYPVINVPTQEEFDAAVKAEQKQKEEPKEEKSRGLPDTKTPLPQLPQVPQTPTSDQVVSDNTSTNNLGVPVIEVPIIGEVPVPPKEQVILAGTTATASVAALIGKSLVEWMVGKMKPIVQQIFVRGKKLLSRDLTPYELQVYFAFEKSQSLKKVNKLLKKERKEEKIRQYKEYHSK